MLKCLLLLLLSLVACSFAAPTEDINAPFAEATACDSVKCVLPDCRCPSTSIPNGFGPKETPQLVYFTFDDAVTIFNIGYYKKAFDGRVNPDGCPVQATFYVSHEYADYSKVHELHSSGHEIALHSITHNVSTDYWKTLSVEGLIAEFGGEKEMLSYFAKIDATTIRGMRLPFLQLSGNNSFEALKKIGLTYDSSWPTLTYMDPGLWPYTLDYLSSQDCGIGPCPTAAIPGVWVSPMVDWYDNDKLACAMVDACVNVTSTLDGYFNFMVSNFKRHYEGNRAPFGFYVHADWFQRDDVRFQAYLKFIDYIQQLKDVYMVGVNRGLEWVRNPVKVGGKLWPACQKTYAPTCTPRACELNKGAELRYMTSCASSCPPKYPWLGNPLGTQ